MLEHGFPPLFTESRSKFLGACEASGISVFNYKNPEQGPNGEELFCDAAIIGNNKSRGVVVVTSGTHGVEGYAGSDIQIGLLKNIRRQKSLSETALLLIHAINPFGMAWLRRENEDNVDINRNFVDHEVGAYPENQLFEELVDFLIPKEWNEEAYEAYLATMRTLSQKYGWVAVRQAMHKGQYTHPDSIHYGGNKATWSNNILGDICEKFLSKASKAIMIDLHTGLGPYGYGELMTPSKPGEPVYELLFEWYGSQVHSTTAGSTQYAGSKGSILAGFKPNVNNLTWAAVGLEFGTRDRDHIRRCMLANMWVHLHGKTESKLGKKIRTQYLDCYYPNESKWNCLVWERSKEIIDIALERMSN